MKANVCKNSTGHQVNKTKYFCLPLFKILEMEDLWYSRSVTKLRFCNIFEENFESIAHTVFY